MSEARPPGPRERFLTALHEAVEAGHLVRLSLGHPQEAGLRKWVIRPVVIRGEACYSLVQQFERQDETKNYPGPEMLERVGRALGRRFLSGHLTTQGSEVSVELGKRPRFHQSAASHPPATLEHDRERKRPVSADAPYLEELGVSDAQGRVRERMGDKYRQIVRFVDLLGAACREALPSGPIHFCDMGAGKGYLTFATYDFLSRTLQREVQGVGVEVRSDLVRLCNTVAKKIGYGGLTFLAGTIDSFPPPQGMNLLIALHACNTATDDAIAAGVRAGASVIVAAPCCHKEARPQLDAATAASPLHDVLRHGLFAERHAEMATDALRALYLEAAGYRVRVAEFVAAEHTAKNVMLLATRRPGKRPQRKDATLAPRIAALKAFYGIKEHRLEALL